MVSEDVNSGAHWDGIYQNWQREGTMALRRDEMSETTEALIFLLGSEGHDLLELGCGPGLFLADLAAQRPDLCMVALDHSSEAVKLARIAAPLAEISEGSVLDPLPFAADSFDFVLSLHLVEHLAEPIKAIREMARVVRPDGLVIINFPYGDQPYELHMHHDLKFGQVELWMREAGLGDLAWKLIPGQPNDQGIIWGSRA